MPVSPLYSLAALFSKMPIPPYSSLGGFHDPPAFSPTLLDPWFFKAFVAVLGIIWMHVRTVVYVSSTIGQPER